jgi:hypothetical protein
MPMRTNPLPAAILVALLMGVLLITVGYDLAGHV